MNSTRLITALLLGFSVVAPLSAQEAVVAASSSPAGSSEADELAKQLANPVAALISVPIQGNIDFGYANDGWKSVTNVQPVVPITLSKDWNVISRTILPLIAQEDITGPGNSEQGLGDTVQSLFFSPKLPTKGGWTWGAGPVFLLPTVTSGLGAKRWGAGPTAVALKQDGPWTYGVLANHIWDFAGSGNADISATFLQPFISWGGLGEGRTLSLNAESTYDWNSEQWTVPVNAIYSKVTKIGGQLISYGVGARVYLDAPSGGPDYGLRVVVTFLFPKK